MVCTRSGFDSSEQAPRSKGCCEKVLREFWLFMLDLTILLVGVLRAPITGRVLLALVTRLLLYATNGVTLYALAPAVLQNGRPATPTGDEQFLAEMVNAILQPAQYATNQDTLSVNPRLKRSTGLGPSRPLSSPSCGP